MLDQIARGQEPTDRAMYRDIYGPSRIDSESSPSVPRSNSKDSGIFGWVVLAIIVVSVFESCDGAESERDAMDQASTVSADHIPAQETSRFSGNSTSSTFEESVTRPAEDVSAPQEINLQNEYTAPPGRRAGPSSIPSGSGAMAENSTPAAAAIEVRYKPEIDIGRCIDSDSYPAKALRTHATGVTRLRLSVDSKGMVVDAEVLKSAGRSREHSLLDKAAVSRLLHRCSGLPQTDGFGNPVSSVVNVDVVWRIE